MRGEEGLHAVLDTLGHDLRGPLFTAYGFLQLAQPKVEGKPAEHLAHAMASVEEATRMVEGVLQWARTDPSRLQPEQLELKGVLQEALMATTRRAFAKGRAIELDAPGELDVTADRRALRYALEHLLDNAVRHGQGDVHVAAGGTSAQWWVEVQDQGQGPPDDAGLLQPFWLAENRAKGVGLALAHRVAGLHGGTITFPRRGVVRIECHGLRGA